MEEAREVLFNEQDEVERDVESYKSEIKFLRELVEKLSQNKSQIVTTIKEVEIPVYKKYPWYGNYEVWCSNNGNNTAYTTVSGNMDNTINAIYNLANQAFKDIQTF